MAKPKISRYYYITRGNLVCLDVTVCATADRMASMECRWHMCMRRRPLSPFSFQLFIYLFYVCVCASVINRSPRRIRYTTTNSLSHSTRAAFKWQNRLLDDFFLNWLCRCRVSFICCLSSSSLVVLLSSSAGRRLLDGLRSNWRCHKIIFIVLVRWVILTHADDGDNDGTGECDHLMPDTCYLKTPRSPTYVWFSHCTRVSANSLAPLSLYIRMHANWNVKCECVCVSFSNSISMTTHCCFWNELFIWVFRWHYCSAVRNSNRKICASDWLWPYIGCDWWLKALCGSAPEPILLIFIENIGWILMVDANDSTNSIILVL